MKSISKIDLLFAVYIFCIVATELMGIKTFRLFNFNWLHLNASVAIFLFPIVFSINDIVIEVFGKERARSMARSGLVVVGMVFGFAALATALPPSTRFSISEPAYDKIFVSSMRIAAASLIAYTIAQLTDILVFTRIREKLGKKALWFRNNISNFVAQLFDTIIFISLAFYSLNTSFGVNAKFLIGLIIPYWLLKCSMSVIETPLVYLGVKWLKAK